MSAANDECVYEWIDQKEHRIRCIYCGHTRKTARKSLDGMHNPCPRRPVIQPPPKVEAASPPPIPPRFTRIKNFSVAAIGHFLNGNPECTQEEIDSRLAICKQCVYFRREHDNSEMGICAHEGCGCNISAQKKYLNKLAWKDQSCPINKWGPIDDGV